MWDTVLFNVLRRFLPSVLLPVLPIALGMAGIIDELFFRKTADPTIIGICAGLVGSPLFTRQDGNGGRRRSAQYRWDEAEELRHLRERESELEDELALQRRRREREREEKG